MTASTRHHCISPRLLSLGQLRQLVLPRTRISCFGVSLFLSLLPFPVAAQIAATKVETPQAAAVKVCSGCHTMEIVMDTPKDYDAWHDTIQSMIDRGAQGTPDEFDLVMQFLFENMTTVDINNADQETLSAVLHTSLTTANAIISRRISQPFRNLSELESSIPGLDRALLDSKRRMIYFQ